MEPAVYPNVRVQKRVMFNPTLSKLNPRHTNTSYFLTTSVKHGAIYSRLHVDLRNGLFPFGFRSNGTHLHLFLFCPYVLHVSLSNSETNERSSLQNKCYKWAPRFIRMSLVSQLKVETDLHLTKCVFWYVCPVSSGLWLHQERRGHKVAVNACLFSLATRRTVVCLSMAL
jgi:hypothetical protein